MPETIDAWKRQLRPLKLVEPALGGSEARKVKMAFIPLGVKLQPNMDDSKAETWTRTMVAAFANFPVRCLLVAMNEALHKSFTYPSDLEEFVRERAEASLRYERRLVQRLEDLLKMLRGTQRPLQIEQREDPMTKEEIRKLVLSDTPLKATLIRLGLSCGSIDATLLAQVRLEEGIADEETS